MNEAVMTEVFARINRIFTGLTQNRLDFVPVDSISSEQWIAHELEMMKSNREGRPAFLHGETNGRFGFPVYVQGSFAGLIVVSGWLGAENSQLLQLAELLTLILASSLDRNERSDNLRFIEERAQMVDPKSNVVPLKRSRSTDEVSDLIPALLPERPVSVDAALTRLSLLIQAPDGLPLHRIAFELHEMSARWAFIALENLAPDILESVESLKALGGVTLYISDLCALSATQQLFLSQYLAIQPGEDMPQIIAGISIPLEIVRAEGRVLTRLLDSFCFSRLDWTERTGRQITNDLVDASLRYILERARESALLRFGMGTQTPAMNIYQFGRRPPTVH